MTEESFCYWLRGFYELNGETALTAEQSLIISQHLTLVFEEKAKTLPPTSKFTPFSLADAAAISSAVVSKADDLIKVYKETKKWVSGTGTHQWGPYTPYSPPTTVSCRDYHPLTAKIC